MATYLLIASLIALLLCIVIILYSYIKLKYTSNSNMNIHRHLNAILNELIQQLRQTQLYPPSPSSGWQLSSISNGYRMWTQSFLTRTHESYTIHGCYCKVPASAQVVLRYIRDPDMMTSWMPNVLSIACSNVDATLPNDLVNTETSQDKMIVELGRKNNIMTYLRRTLDGPTTTTYRRLWLRENNGCCWMLMYNVANHSWLYILCQPIEDVARSMLTVLEYDTSFWSRRGEQASILLRSMTDMLSHRKCMITPLLPGNSVVHYSLLPKSKFLKSRKMSVKAALRRHKSVELPRRQQADPSTSDSQDCLSNWSVLRDETFSELEKSIENVVNEDANQNQQRLVPGRASTGQDLSRDVQEDHRSVLNVVGTDVSSPADTRAINGALDATSSGNTSRIGSLMGSRDDGAVTPTTSDDVTVSDSESASDEALEVFENGTWGSAGNSAGSSAVASTMCTDEEKKAKEIKKLHFGCNQAAAELQTLILAAQNVNLDEQNGDTPRNPQEWMFCTVEQDVVVLKRMFRAKNAKVIRFYHINYLGKGIIESSPCLVWDTVRNPRIRFTYDDTLKKVDVVSVIEETMKIVYYYHEIIQLFRKGSCDFTLVQKERQDNETYMLSMHSFPNDETNNGSPKVKILPSGWFLEKIVKEGQVCTMVTYITQVEIPSSVKATKVTLVDEQMSKQPLAIVPLRDYLRPFTQFCTPRGVSN